MTVESEQPSEEFREFLLAEGFVVHPASGQR